MVIVASNSGITAGCALTGLWPVKLRHHKIFAGSPRGTFLSNAAGKPAAAYGWPKPVSIVTRARLGLSVGGPV
jgi:hypothetical protein